MQRLPRLSGYDSYMYISLEYWLLVNNLIGAIYQFPLIAGVLANIIHNFSDLQSCSDKKTHENWML